MVLYSILCYIIATHEFWHRFPPSPPTSDGSLTKEKKVYFILSEFFLTDIDTDRRAALLLTRDIPIYLLSDMIRYDLFPLLVFGEFDSEVFPQIGARRKRGWARRILERILELLLWYMIVWVVNEPWIETQEKMKKYVPKFDPRLLEE